MDSVQCTYKLGISHSSTYNKIVIRQAYNFKILLIIGLLMLSKAALATPTPQPAVQDLTQLSIEDLMNVQVTTASKRSERISQCPAAVYVITHDDIYRYGYRTLGDALRRIAGFYTSTDLSYSYLGVRGYSRPGDYNTRILVLIDGHRVNDPVFDIGTISEILPVDISNIERVEVVKGPGSALWGNNALLAVVNVITRKGHDIQGSNIITRYGSKATSKGTFEYGIEEPGGLEFACSATSYRSDGDQSIYFPEFDTPSTNNGLAQNIDDEEANKGYIAASYKGLNFFYYQSNRRKTPPTGIYGTIFGSMQTYVRNQARMAELSFDKLISPEQDGKLFCRVYSNESSTHGQYPYDSGSTDPLLNVDDTDSRWWGAEARYTLSFSPRLSAIFGTEYQNINKLYVANYDLNPYFLYGSADNNIKQRSFYAQADYQLSNALRLVAGSRLDDYSTFGTTLNPRGALIYSHCTKDTVKLLYGKAFRAPNGLESEYYTSSPGGQISNPALVPERIVTNELVWEREVNSHTRFTASLFRFDLRNIITQVEVPGGYYQFQNLGFVRNIGVEMQFESRINGDTTDYLSLGVVNSKDSITGSRATNSPDFVAACGVSFPIWSRRLYITPELQVIGPRKTLAGNTIGTTAVANLTLVTRQSSSKSAFSINICNLFNTPTFAPSSPSQVQDKIPQYGRSIIAQVTYNL